MLIYSCNRVFFFSVLIYKKESSSRMITTVATVASSLWVSGGPSTRRELPEDERDGKREKEKERERETLTPAVHKTPVNQREIKSTNRVLSIVNPPHPADRGGECLHFEGLYIPFTHLMYTSGRTFPLSSLVW